MIFTSSDYSEYQVSQGGWELVTWIQAFASNGERPDGKAGEFRRVPEGTEVVLDGPFSGPNTRYLGVFPEYFSEFKWPDRQARCRLKAPVVVYPSGDGPVYVCATDEQLAAAQKTTAFRQWLFRRWDAEAEHCRQYHHGGSCHYGRGNPHAGFDTGLEAEFLTRGRPYLEEYLGVYPDTPSTRYTPDVWEELNGIIPAEPVPAEQVARYETPFFRLEAEYKEELKPGKREFARQQHEKLVAMGFSQKRAISIMRAAGPGRAVAAAEWAQQALAKVGGSVDALDIVLSGIGGTNGFGRIRTEAALRALGLEPPKARSSSALFATLMGAREALRDLPTQA